MARSSSGGDLFITVGGDVTPLRTAMKAGKSVLNEFGLAAIDVQKEVGDAFANLGANAPAQAKKLEQAFAATFNEIRRNAQAVLSAPANDQALGILNVAGSREAAAAAEAEANALRQVADAAARADAAAGGTNAGVRLLAVSSEAAAVQAAQHAAALKTQAAALETVQSELGTATGAEVAFGDSQATIAKSSSSARMAQMELLHSVRASVDQFAFGTPMAQIFSLQIAQLGQAATMAGSSFGKFGAFLSGPYGIALIAISSLTATLISRHQGAAKAATDHGDAEAVLIGYLNGEAVANEVVLDSLIKLNDQEGKSLDLKDQQIRKTIELTNAILDQAQANRAALAVQLAQAKEAAAASAGPQVGIGQQGGIGIPGSVDSARVANIQSALDQLDQVIGQALARIANNEVKLARDLATNVGRANADFDNQQAALEAKYRGVESYSVNAKGQTVTTLHGGLLNQPGLSDTERDRLTTQLSAAEERLSNARAKAVASAQKLDQAEQGQASSATRAASATHDYGKQIDFAGAEAIAKGAGLKVTSGYRSEADQARLYNDPRYNHPGNPVARPGTSAHEGVNGKWALDIAFAPGLTPAKLKQIYGDKGVSLSAVYKESGHYHIEGSRSNAAAADRTADRAAQKTTDQNDYYAQQMQQLDGALIQARGELLGDIDQQAKFASDQIESDRKAYDLSVQKAVDDGKIRDAQGQELTARNDAVAAQRQANLAVRTFTQKEDDLQKTIDQDYDFRRQNLQYQQDIARSSKERRDIALQIVDLEYQQKKSDLDIAKAKATEAQNWSEVARIDAQLAALPGQKAQAQGAAAQANQSPAQDYFDKLPSSLDEVKDRLDEIEVTGLKELNKDAADAITNFLHLKGALGDVVNMLLQLAFDAALKAAFPNGLSFGGAKASGGPVNSSNWYVVGENGPEIFVPTGSGTIVPNGMASASAPRPLSLVPANGNQPQRAIVELHLKDEMLEAKIVNGADVRIARMYPAMKADMQQTIAEQKRRAA